MNDWNNDYKPLEQTSPVSPNPLPSPASPPSNKRSFLLLCSVLLFLLGIGIGYGVGLTRNGSTGDLSYDDAITLSRIDRSVDGTAASDFSLYWKVWDMVKENAVDQPVNEKDLLYGSIAGLVSGLHDPYSVFFSPEESQQFVDHINGTFEGVGIELGIKDDQLSVIAPIAGTPADIAGIRAGDVILAIDSVDSSVFTLQQAVDAIRGEKGTTVTLLIQRSGVDDPFDVAIVRETIHVESVKWKMIESGGKKIAVITLTQFNRDTQAKFEEAVSALVLQQPDGLILDLRNNPGGFLDTSVNIASKFIDEGQVAVYEQYSSGDLKTYNTAGASPLRDMATVVLMNEGSASASEILAGALQDAGKAMVVGTTSYGKGTVQDVRTLEDGSALKLTVARWLTPNKNQIDGVGIEPNVVVDRTLEEYQQEKDPQLDAATLYFADRSAFDQQYMQQQPEEIIGNTNQ